MRIVSLFANIGVAEACLHELNSAHVVVANELLPRRAALYHAIYPETNMICGDITDENIYQQILYLKNFLVGEILRDNFSIEQKRAKKEPTPNCPFYIERK